MIREMLQFDLKDRDILDMGCGTGILAICAAKMGARRVLGVDKDQWAYENALENVVRNGTGGVEIRLGEVNLLKEEQFDLILANITRNILVRDMSAYEAHLKKNGMLIVCGFLAEDVQFVLNAAYRSQLSHLHTIEESNWICLSFTKQ
jgi:ribosomal protein L11 methyltransferase